MVIKQAFSKVRNGFTDFRSGLSIVFSKPEPGEGDRKLAKISTIIESQINKHTKHSIRQNVIKDIERVLSNKSKKGGKEAVDKKIAICFATPEWARLLRRLDLNESHVRIIAMEVMKRHAK